MSRFKPMVRVHHAWPLLLATLLLGLPSPGVAAEPTRGGTLKFVTQNDLKMLDPYWTTAYISRNHGYMIYDVLFALDQNLQVQPQMVDTWDVSADRCRRGRLSQTLGPAR